MEAISYKLPVFEGPLDLLLQLVQKIVFASDLRKHIGLLWLRSTDGLIQFHFFGHKNPSLSDIIGQV